MIQVWEGCFQVLGFLCKALKSYLTQITRVTRRFFRDKQCCRTPRKRTAKTDTITEMRLPGVPHFCGVFSLQFKKSKSLVAKGCTTSVSLFRQIVLKLQNLFPVVHVPFHGASDFNHMHTQLYIIFSLPHSSEDTVYLVTYASKTNPWQTSCISLGFADCSRTYQKKDEVLSKSC